MEIGAAVVFLSSREEWGLIKWLTALRKFALDSFGRRLSFDRLTLNLEKQNEN